MPPADPRLLALRDSLTGQVLLGTRGARYHVRERVGEGGQGWVFRANWDEPGGYAVIVKVLRPDAATPESLARFEREAQVLRMLGQAARPNPHVVRFFDHATASLALAGAEPVSLPFTVLEYVRGPTLESVLLKSRGTGLVLDRVRRIGRQVALALEDVHAHKVVHRDLKPSNVLLASEADSEVAKVTDFGLVKLVDVGLGRTVAIAGASLGYAPPEQFEQGNRRVGPRTDVFSFAAMLYEMLAGVKAFPYGDGENPLVVVTRLLNGPRPSLARTRGALPHELAVRPDLVERLDPVLVRATAAEPSERQRTIGELWSAVEAILREASERPSPAAGVAATAADVATAMDLRTPPPAPPPPPRGARLGRQTAGGLDAASDGVSAASPADAEFARPAAWSWRVRVAPAKAGIVRAAAFEPSGDVAFAVGAGGTLAWKDAGGSGGWVVSPSSADVDPRRVRGLTWVRSGEFVVFGARGLAARFVPGSSIVSWATPDDDVTFLGAHADAATSSVTLVGERPGRRPAQGATRATTAGVVAHFVDGKFVALSEVPACARLRGVTSTGDRRRLCCGDWGAIVRVDSGVAEHVGSICGGHLYAINALRGGGAITVGAGGHALSLSPRLEAQLEAVQTTRDLLALAVDPNGVAWAGSAQARLLRRTNGSWVRMSAELGLSSSVVALWAAPRSVRAICDDGAIIEGVVQR